MSDSTRARVAVGSSPIHGKGLFAQRRFRKDSYIATFEGEPTRSNGMHVLWLIDEDGTETGIRGKNDLRFLNHSKRPNAEFRGVDLYALGNIQPGCEVTIDYGPEWHDLD